MDKSTDALITNVFENRLRSGSRNNQEFKATQLTSGASGVLAYTIENPVTWDRTETLPYVDPAGGGFGDVELTVTFTSDGSQKYPFAIPFSDLRINGTGEDNKVKFKSGMYWWNFGVWTGPYVQCQAYDLPSVAAFADEDKMKWVIRFYYVGNITYYLKLGSRATCGGTISVARTL